MHKPAARARETWLVERGFKEKQAFSRCRDLHWRGYPKSHEGRRDGVVPGAGLPHGENDLNPHYRLPDEVEKTLGHQETGYDTSEWQRWDEDLVEDFGRWLGRIAKAFTIVLLVGSSLIAVLWLWGKF